MKRRIPWILAVVIFCVAACLGLVACNKATIRSVSLGAMPTKTNYYIGDALDIGGCTLNVVYSNGTVKTVEVTEEMVNGFSTESLGHKPVQIRYKEGKNTYMVTISLSVVSRPPTRLEVAQNPTKTEYVEGETISISGLKLRVYTTETESHTVDEGALVYKPQVAQEGMTSFGVSYQGLTIQVPIRVVKRMRKSLTAVEAEEGSLWQYSALSSSQLAFFYVCNDGSWEPAPGDVTVAEAGERLHQVGEKTLHLSYEADGVSYQGTATVTVQADTLVSAEVKDATYAFSAGDRFVAQARLDLRFAHSVWRDFVVSPSSSYHLDGLGISIEDGTVLDAGKHKAYVLWQGKQVGWYYVCVDTVALVRLEAEREQVPMTVAIGDAVKPNTLVLYGIYSDGSRVLVWNYNKALIEGVTFSPRVVEGDTTASLYVDELSYSFPIEIADGEEL